MKKIEREAFLIPEYQRDNKGEMWMDMVESDIYCKVKKSDLDKLELDVEVLNCGIRERDEIIKTLKQQMDEAAKALIKSTTIIQERAEYLEFDEDEEAMANELYLVADNNKMLLETLTGQTWEEIKESEKNENK